MNPETTPPPGIVNTPQISETQANVQKKSVWRYLWYYAPLTITLLAILLIQILTKHTCRHVAPSDQGECIPGLWFFPAVIVSFIGFWTGIVMAIMGTVRFIKAHRQES